MYKLIRPLLFTLEPEASHRLGFGLAHVLHRIPGAAACLTPSAPSLPIEVMGLRFDNPVGLAAGLDKNAEHAELLSAFGFGWLELGTVTPRAQPGNPKPRLFRLTQHEAIINRLGFNSAGIEQFLANLRAHPRPCPIGINIGRNRDTSDGQSLSDYVLALRAVYADADYVAINVSSPNTPRLRNLQLAAQLDELLSVLARERAALTEVSGRRVPLALKIAPDLEDDQLAAVADAVERHRIDAVIATNTTVSRAGLPINLATEEGGLSGRPLRALALAVVRKLYARLQGRVPIIGAGGITNAGDAWERMVAGADCVQLYTALIYHGPGIVQDIVRGLIDRVHAMGCTELRAALDKARAHT